MNQIKTKLRVMIQCESKVDGIGTFLQYVEPNPLAGEQYSDTYRDCVGLFSSFEYKKAKTDGMIVI